LRQEKCFLYFRHGGEQAVFGDRAGMEFVECLLKHPGEVIHSLALLARVQGEAPVQQRCAVLDDRDATRDSSGRCPGSGKSWRARMRRAGKRKSPRKN
jgi:hypothetical protein